MKSSTAEALWGQEVVLHALREPESEPLTKCLVREVAEQARVLNDSSFAHWGLSLPWPRFCAVVRLLTGHAWSEVQEGEK